MDKLHGINYPLDAKILLRDEMSSALKYVPIKINKSITANLARRAIRVSYSCAKFLSLNRNWLKLYLKALKFHVSLLNIGLQMVVVYFDENYPDKNKQVMLALLCFMACATLAVAGLAPTLMTSLLALTLLTHAIRLGYRYNKFQLNLKKLSVLSNTIKNKQAQAQAQAQKTILSAIAVILITARGLNEALYITFTFTVPLVPLSISVLINVLDFCITLYSSCMLRANASTKCTVEGETYTQLLKTLKPTLAAKNGAFKIKEITVNKEKIQQEFSVVSDSLEEPENRTESVINLH